MNSLYASDITKQVIWPQFVAHFKSETTKASYLADISEIMNLFHQDFLDIGKKEIKEYYDFLQNKVKQGILQPGTMAKKFKELHSFAEYICKNKAGFPVGEEYVDEYYPYLKLVEKQKQFVKSVPVEHVDRMLKAAEDDMMAYCILVLLHRVGLTSTEIIGLMPEDIGEYADGLYVQVKGRRDACYIPDDAAMVLKEYYSMREDNIYLFYNQKGKPLNTMYISRMMKKYTKKAGVPNYSAQNLRNTCAVTLFAYGADKEQVADQIGVTQIQIHRYCKLSYRDNLQKEANRLVKLKVEPPVM